MFGHITRAASRPAVAAAAAAAAANAAQGSVQARAPPQGARQAGAHPPVHSKIVDRDTEDWIMAELKDEVVLFQPFDGREVEEAASTVMTLWAGRAPSTPRSGPIITEPGEDADGGSSSCGEYGDDLFANAVIEAAAAANADAVAQGRSKDREQLESLMAITTRMLKRPGLQREVVMCMMEDSEVRDLMLRQCTDLDRYLLAAGIHNPALLPPPPSESLEIGNPEGDRSARAGATDTPTPKKSASASSRGSPLISRLVGVVAGALERAGDVLASLGNWLRRQVLAAFPQDDDGDEHAAAEAYEGGSGPRGQRTANQVLGGVMVLVVAVFCVAVIRRPLVLHALRRR
ncbi:hypothetical protein VOLCADRAFT_103542 [Volvox carteri f. nagariensis]|uniref:Uncharacterized protein n=1 Tax=Volvox carteri f. nagariensis TaxID=3068 RepID=D8TML1_VOLCA|nr:uncharacterized protein VOLCADRAFT_103542 [Volvox carteri f. nagariensis]EFJ51275.1 hypothetical protein VOLCADRAFT_103542 [Volvox carteri f. nagariensis]|eukprot:XP_002947742.1 hypothetical protein VOLCADRAFT_103542 [Volvox carteri f. nagariensis]